MHVKVYESHPPCNLYVLFMVSVQSHIWGSALERNPAFGKFPTSVSMHSNLLVSVQSELYVCTANVLTRASMGNGVAG